jgi:hypothetical protein
MPQLRESLKAIQLRASVAEGRQLTHGDLARIAKVNQRALGEWMRGGAAPKGMSAVFNLLAALPREDLEPILQPWRQGKR